MRSSLIACTIALIASSASAQWYGGPALMVGFSKQRNVEQEPRTALSLSDETDSAGVNVGVGAWLGYDFKASGSPVQLEMSGNWHYRHDLNIRYVDTGGLVQGVKANVQTTDFMLSLLYDLPTHTRLQPYVGAGGGFVYATSDSYQLGVTNLGTSTDINPAWQLQTGLKYPLTATSKLRLDYRYIDMGTVETNAVPAGEKFAADLASHDIRLGVTWDF